MADEQNKAHDFRKILDNEGAIVLFRNLLGSYTAKVVSVARFNKDLMDAGEENHYGGTPTQALDRLTEKFATGRIVGA